MVISKPCSEQVHEALVLETFPSPLVLRLTASLPPPGQASLSVVATVIHSRLVGVDATRRLTIPVVALQPGGQAACGTAAGTDCDRQVEGGNAEVGGTQRSSSMLYMKFDDPRDLVH